MKKYLIALTLTTVSYFIFAQPTFAQPDCQIGQTCPPPPGQPMTAADVKKFLHAHPEVPHDAGNGMYTMRMPNGRYITAPLYQLQNMMEVHYERCHEKAMGLNIQEANCDH